jgi:glycosyltransferase involved in cell wall biosynthesis
MVRVALESSFLSLPPSGTQTYLHGLIGGMRALDPDFRLALLAPNAPLNGSVRRLRRAKWELLDVARTANREAFDLLHIPHFSAPVPRVSPLIVTIHDLIPLILPEYRASRAMRAHLAIVSRTVRRAELILTPSRSAKSDIVRVLGIPDAKVLVTPEAADHLVDRKPEREDIAVLRQYGISGRFAFNVGGLDVRKNLPALVEAFAKLRVKTEEKLQLVIAGERHSDNPFVYPPLQPAIERAGLAGSVKLIGRISEADKLALYRSAALYVSPSLYEGFGLTPLEAMTFGVPAIVANRTSLPEVVGDGGLCVEPDPDALAAAMLDVFTDPALAVTLRERALQRASQFSWRETARLTIDAYNAILERTRGRSHGE